MNSSVERIDELLMLTIVNTISASLIKLVTGFIEGIFSKIKSLFTSARDYISDWRYGKMLRFIIITTGNEVRKPPIARYFFEYLETEHGFHTERYTNYRNELVKDDMEVGNQYIGATYRCVAGDEEKNKSQTNTFTFYSRMHPQKEFEALCNEIIKKSVDTVIYERRIVKYSRNRTVMYPFDNSVEDPYAVDKAEKIKNKIESLEYANILLHGPPGTGKTNMIKYIAKKMDASLIICNFHDFSNLNQLHELLVKKSITALDLDADQNVSICTKKKFYIFEDFDTMLPAKFWNARRVEQIERETKTTSYESMPDYKYSDMLNLLDGIIKNFGAYIFFTTNHLDKIDSAFYRPGRMHLNLYVGALEKDQMCNFIKDKYKTNVTPKEIKRTATLAEMYALYSLTKKSGEFITRLNNNYYSSLGKDVI